MNRDFRVLSTSNRVRHLVNALLVHLQHMSNKPSSCITFLGAIEALEMLQLLMLNQDLLIIEVPLTIVTERSKGGFRYRRGLLPTHE